METKEIPRLAPPPEGETRRGWCLYHYDRWDGEVPHDWDEKGWFVYPDIETAYRGLARELRRRCELFDAGLMHGGELACDWYPVEVTYLPDGYVEDERGAIFEPGYPW